LQNVLTAEPWPTETAGQQCNFQEPQNRNCWAVSIKRYHIGELDDESSRILSTTRPLQRHCTQIWRVSRVSTYHSWCCPHFYPSL